jgi:hypothetical protein
LHKRLPKSEKSKSVALPSSQSSVFGQTMELWLTTS